MILSLHEVYRYGDPLRVAFSSGSGTTWLGDPLCVVSGVASPDRSSVRSNLYLHCRLRIPPLSSASRTNRTWRKRRWNRRFRPRPNKAPSPSHGTHARTPAMDRTARAKGRRKRDGAAAGGCQEKPLLGSTCSASALYRRSIPSPGTTPRSIRSDFSSGVRVRCVL